MSTTIKYLLPAVTLLSLAASCAVDNSAAEAQSKIDSVVTARVTALEMWTRKNNDSIILHKAIARADSIMADSTNLLLK